jgi:hypothetical protein
LSQGDPTDQTLAVIASIFERAEARPAAADAAEAAQDAQDAQPDAPDAPDDALASGEAETPAAAPIETAAAVSDGVEGYSKFGPGPLDSLRFRWTARRGDDGHYYVDETIGRNSLPISSGPMPRDAVIRFIDERARDAQQRFDALRRQIFDPPSERGPDDAES